MNRPSMTPDEALALAKEHTRRGNIEAAIGIYQSILARSPQHKKAKKALNALHKADGNKSTTALKADMDAVLALYGQGKQDQAMTQVKRLCKIHPDQPMPLNVMGAILAGQGNHQQALEQYQKALALAPDYLDALNNMGSSLHIMGRHEDAINAFQSLLAMNPQYADGHYNLGNVLISENRTDDAIESYERALAINAALPRYHIKLGQALAMSGRHNPAMVSYRTALELDPNRPDALELMGNALVEQGLRTSAISWYRDAARIVPDNAMLQLKLGEALLQTGEIEQAISALEASIDLAPDSNPAEHYLAAAKGLSPQTPPEGYITNLFDTDYARNFEQRLVEGLQYDAPTKLRNLVEQFGNLSGPVPKQMDLGCGSGLCAIAFKGLFEHIEGIDLSPNMLAEAEKKEIYDSLHLGDIANTLDQLDQTFELFTCADTLIYLGNLGPVMQSISNRAAKDALIAFSTEHFDGEGYKLLNSGRYAHSKEYVVDCAKEAGFELVAYEESNLRKESYGWIAGGFYLMKKR